MSNMSACSPDDSCRSPSPERQAAFATRTLVCERVGRTVFFRDPLLLAPATAWPPLGGLRDAEGVHGKSVLVLGTHLLEVLEAADDDRLVSYLRRWVAIAESQAERGGYGSLENIDREWDPPVVFRVEFLARAC